VSVDTEPASEKISRTRRILKLVLDFVLGQGAIQAIGVLSGLFLVRNLSVSDYAKFGLASAFQATASILMDLGYASTIIPLVGDRVADRALVGKYVRAAKTHRARAYWAMSPIAAIAFLFVTHRQRWDWPTQLILLSSVLLALYSSGPVSIYAAPLILHRRLRAYYAPLTISSFCRLVTYVLLRFVGTLNAWTAAGLSALNITLDGFVLKHKSRQSIDWPETDDPAIKKEVWQYILPATPAIILGAFHGQIALFLVGIFGNTVTIGQVAALSRFALLFNVMMTFNMVIVEPYVARLPRGRLLGTYFKLIAIALVGCAVVTLIAFGAPGIFLWLLGPQYQGLRSLIGWVFLTACINYTAGLIWIMNRSRRWLFWRGTIAEISLLAMVQIGFLFVFGVRSTKDAVMFNFASSFCYLAAHSYIAIHGFRKGVIGDALDAAPPEISLP
jgi:hypothetical protein